MLAAFAVTNRLDGPVAAAGDLPGSLRQAIFDANAAPGPDTIEFAGDEFFGAGGTIALNSGELHVSEDLAVHGPGRDILTIDAQQNSRIFAVSGSGNVAFAGLTLTGGASLNPIFRGGAIRALGVGNVLIHDSSIVGNTAAFGGAVDVSLSGILTITNSIVSGNVGTMGGGAISTAGNVSVADSEFVDNKSGGDGGAIRAEGNLSLLRAHVTNNRTVGNNAAGGGLYARGDVFLADSTVVGNRTSGDESPGGGIFAGDGHISLENSIVSANNTSGAESPGGGIYSSAGNVTLSDSLIDGNSTFGFSSRGGGIYSAGGDVAVTVTTISGNSTLAEYAPGGGAYLRGDVITISHSTISHNSTSHSYLRGLPSSDGAGVSSNVLTLENSTVVGNRIFGDGNGAGLFIGNGTIVESTITNNHVEGSGNGGGISAGALSVTRSTISGNSSVTAGGLWTRTLRQLHSSIVAGNSAAAGNPDLQIELETGSLRYSIVGDNAGTTLAEAQTRDSHGNLIGSAAGAGVIDPLLGPLADNGGPAQTHALLPGSPAIDGGDPSIEHDSNGFDQRGAPFVRVADGDLLTVIVVDVGAYEAQGPPSADFNRDLNVTGADFLAWQRGFGSTAAATRPDGNSDDDGDVDASDLAAWEATFGKNDLSTVSNQRSAISSASEPAAASLASSPGVAPIPILADTAYDEQEALAQPATAAETPRERAFAQYVSLRRGGLTADFGDIVTNREQAANAATLQSFFGPTHWLA